MRKREWIRCKDPQQMLQQVVFNSNPRRLRLFALMAGRSLWQRLDQATCREALELAWRQAEGTTTMQDVEGVFEALLRIYDEAGAINLVETAHTVYALAWLFRDPMQSAFALVRPFSLWGNVPPFQLLDSAALEACCWLFRDIFGDRGHSLSADPDWQSWNNGTVPMIAQAIYDDRAFDRLPILADSLEQAGCDNEEILSHCRQPGEHVRGCWVLDLVLGKE